MSQKDPDPQQAGARANVINLRLARKAKARAQAEQHAEQNRITFGRSKTEKAHIKAEKARIERIFAAKKLEKDETTKPQTTEPQTIK